MCMAERIKERRLSMGYTQEELGEKLGLQKSAIAKYENGRVENIKRSVIAQMAKVLECSPSYLMGWEAVPGEEPQHQDTDQAVLDLYHRLDSTDQAKVVERMEVLLEADKYAKGKESQAG